MTTERLEGMRVHGHYARRLAATTALPQGIQADVRLVLFGDIGDERRPIIVSDEPLAHQTIKTDVPNRPSEIPAGDPEIAQRPALLRVQALSPRIVRVRLGLPDELARPREFGMVVPGALDAFPALPSATYDETDEQVIMTIAGLTVRLRRDPFAISITCAGVPDAVVETALDDRNVHGLLCTPPPGIMSGGDGAGDGVGDEAFWSWALTPDERLYGLGERFTPLDHRGEYTSLWVTDAWGTTTDASYKCVPFLHSSRGYGLFFHTPALVTARLGRSSRRAAQVSVSEPSLDLFVVFGPTPADILREYTALTGRPAVPPRWAFGVWLSRCRYQNRREVEEAAARARAEDVPCDVLHIDPAWLEHPALSCDFVANDDAFPDLAGMVRELGAQGFKVLLWELPYMSPRARRYAEAVAHGYFLRDEHGAVAHADFGGRAGDGSARAVLDFTNPAARAWWQDLHRPWLQAGVAVFKTDFGEGVPVAARAHNGMTGHALHNLFPLLYNGAVHEVITQETGRPGLVWGRSGWAGCQRYPAQWGGDPKTDLWSMASSLRGGLNMALSAPGVWAHDIGGFYGPPPSPELYIRWAQFGLLSPLARAHGTTPREPWEFGAAALAIFRRYAKLRTRLAPYLYTLAWEAHDAGLPMLRPLLLHYPDDPIAPLIDDCYLLGPDLLVAPVFSESPAPVARRLYLPPGVWVDFWTDEPMTGGRYITRVAPLDTIPLYVRAGALLPLGPELPYIGDEAPDTLTLDVYAGVEGSRRVVWDAAGTATNLTLRRAGLDWRLEIQGERAAHWRVRWHTGDKIVEADLGYSAAATTVLDGTSATIHASP